MQLLKVTIPELRQVVVEQLAYDYAVTPECEVWVSPLFGFLITEVVLDRDGSKVLHVRYVEGVRIVSPTGIGLLTELCRLEGIGRIRVTAKSADLSRLYQRRGFRPVEDSPAALDLMKEITNG